MVQRTLRFGVISPGPFLEHWQVSCVQNLVSEGSVLQVILSSNVSEGGSVSSARIQRNARERLQVDISTIYPQTPIMTILTRPAHSGIVESTRDDVRKVESLELDFILNFSRENLPVGFLTAARFGVWSFRHGSSSSTGLECFWELYDDRSVTPAILEKIEPPPEPPTTLWTGYYRTIRSSYTRNLDQVLAGTTTWPAKIVSQIRAGNSDWDLGRAELPKLSENRPPNRTRVSVLLLKTSKRRVEAL